MESSRYNSKGILEQLDAWTQKTYGMPFLDEGQCYPIELRMTLYRDALHWGITIEEVIFSPRAEGHAGIITSVFSYGNGLRVRVGGNNLLVYKFTTDGPEGRTFVIHEFPHWEHLAPSAKSIRIRDQVVALETSVTAYEEMGIRLLDPPRIKAHEMLRALPRQFRQMLLTTGVERQKKFRSSARGVQVLQLDEWYHPKLSNGELPSKTETFRLLAEVLVTGDTSRYQPCQLPNTHWSNWPTAGLLERPLEGQ